MTRLPFLAVGLLVSACAAAPPAPPPQLRSPLALPPAPPPVALAPPEPSPEPSPPAAEPGVPPAAELTSPARAPIPIRKGTRVLMFGDSMVTSGLGSSLQERVVAQGGKFFHVSKPSSTTLSWTEGRVLQDLVQRTRPDVVIVVLASNELFVPNPHARTTGIRAIVQRIGDRPCLWVGPAPWLPEKGIIGVVRESSGPCRFFDSSAIKMERGPDHIHPTLSGGKTWANAVWQEAFAE